MPHLSSGQNARRAHSPTYSPPIIDDLDKYQFAVLGSSLRSLGRPVSLGLTRKQLARRKEKNEQKGGGRKVFFFVFAVFKIGTKVVMLLMNTFCQNITERSPG